MKKTQLIFVWLTLMLQAGLRLGAADLAAGFRTPPPEARPWVYWYFMDGNMTREGMTADLEAMKQAGLGGAIFLEVNLGIPRGPVEFMSQPWQGLMKHAASEADRLGLQLALGSGPGWAGTGGPWVQPEQAMQHLVASETNVSGPEHFEASLPQPKPRPPFFGMGTLTPELKQQWQKFYRDVAVLAYPTPAGNYRIPDVDEKALFYRAPYSSQAGVKPRLTPDETVLPTDECIPAGKVIELTGKLSAAGRLTWDVPAGNWTLVRLGRTLTGQTTRPAPQPGLGFESDKFSQAALDAHFANFTGKLLKTSGEPKGNGKGIVGLHFDSWEMSSQNWSENFRADFKQRRGYDPLPYLPAMYGHPVGSVEMSERFLWDLRRTAQELVLENHVAHLRDLGRQHHLTFSSETYDMNPAGDLFLGGVADVPMGEFWSRGYGFSAEFSCFEAVSIGHTTGRKIIGAEAFTSTLDKWKQYPWAMKQQGDWALCNGINRFVIHRYQHQPTLDEAPGMTFGNRHGVHWERTETWWSMVDGYHLYLSRAQYLLRQGLPVADILYLDVQGAPDVFTPPKSAMLEGLQDRRGYNFDGCAPDTLIARAKAKDGRIVFPDGMSYRLLVLPRVTTMTPALAQKIEELAAAGVPVLGRPPERAPGLQGFPKCDDQVRALAGKIWQSKNVVMDSAADSTDKEIYPDYDTAARMLAQHGIEPDFESSADLRYTHRHDPDYDLYMVGNRTDTAVSADCSFRVSGLRPELWDAVTGEERPLPEFREINGRTIVPLQFAPAQSFFIVFRKGERATGVNFPEFKTVTELSDPWMVTFDAKWGGPSEPVKFDALVDWTERPEDGIRYYSGTASYAKTFDAPLSALAAKPVVLTLGALNSLARVELNGRDLGVVWCAPWQIAVPAGLLKPTGNELRIRVANRWPNRLIKDAGLPADQRLTKTTWNPYKPGDPLLPSGLLGPVTLRVIMK
ncbi:MAG TPA: glycosyl hydrolase [bacterium]|nr:glycosyl hydrolase [bacterium]